jgi:rhamnogalacturonyl hydrolase YesR
MSGIKLLSRSFRALLLAVLVLASGTAARAQTNDAGSAERAPVFNRAPLAEAHYARLPLGDVQPEGWLDEQLQRMAEGMGGNLDELYANVGPNNAWVGGNGDNWERGPYWLDGLVPLAYLTGDQELIDKAKTWIEWSLESQEESGYFGPDPDKDYADAPEGRHGAYVQTDNPGDWWPRMVVLKAMASYYEATGDERVIDFMTDYFRYQAQTLPDKPLGHWTWWSKMRGGENQLGVYWLYNRTGDDFLLDLAPLVEEQTAGWTEGFLNNDPPSHHGVNVAMGLKQPALAFQQTKDSTHLRSVRQALAWLMREHGQPQGMFSGDEPLHGTDPTHGTELCTVVELMYSLQLIARTTGNVRYMDHLEKVALNALPTQHKDDYMGRQYYQQPNQVQISRAPKSFKTGGSGIRICYGLTNGYPCCTTNMHQGWPKYARNLWMAAPDGGLAALFYAPSTLETSLDGQTVRFREETNYPFDDEIRFTYEGDEAARFPLHLRIPDWTSGTATISVNGEEVQTPEGGRVVQVERAWESGDTVTLTLPMTIRSQTWHERSASVERGPLVYALRVRGDWNQLDTDYSPPWDANREVPTWKVQPTSSWNYGLVMNRRQPAKAFEFERDGEATPEYPWTADNVPVKLVGTGKQLPQWKLYNEGAGPLPPSPTNSGKAAEEITLIPYGATTLRVSEFPVIRP